MNEVFSNCSMTWLYRSDAEADTGIPCKVIIGGGHIEVIYDYDDEFVK